MATICCQCSEDGYTRTHEVISWDKLLTYIHQTELTIIANVTLDCTVSHVDHIRKVPSVIGKLANYA